MYKQHLFPLLFTVLSCFLLVSCTSSDSSKAPSSSASVNSTIGSTSADLPERLNVTLDVSIEGDDGSPIIVLNTNLPDGTKLSLSLTNNASYKKEAIVTIKDGKAETAALRYIDGILIGDYSLTVNIFPSAQAQSVKNIIGNNCEYLFNSTTNETGAQAIYRKLVYHSPYQQKPDDSEFDVLQSFYTKIPTSITPDGLEVLLASSELFYDKSHCTMNRRSPNEDRYLRYTISMTENPICLYDGKVMNAHINEDYIIVVFDDDTLTLEYILYINHINDSFNCALYYATGSFGDLRKIWDDYTIEKAGGNYYCYQSGLGESVPNELILHYRDDDDVPYYQLRGSTVYTGYVKCDNAEDAVKKTFPWLLTQNDEVILTSTKPFASTYKTH